MLKKDINYGELVTLQYMFCIPIHRN